MRERRLDDMLSRRRSRAMTDEARALLAGDLDHFFLMPLGLLEYSELEPDLIRITNANGSFCLTIRREPQALSKADAIVRIVNDWYATHGSDGLRRRLDAQKGKR